VDNQQRSFLVPVAEVINPVVGFRTTYQELLDYSYYLPKECGYSLADINNLTYEWAQILFNKLEEDKKEEAKRQKEENERQEREYNNQQQMMNNSYNNYGNLPAMPNYNI